jgi:hypothetical protein
MNPEIAEIISELDGGGLRAVRELASAIGRELCLRPGDDRTDLAGALSGRANRQLEAAAHEDEDDLGTEFGALIVLGDLVISNEQARASQVRISAERTQGTTVRQRIHVALSESDLRPVQLSELLGVSRPAIARGIAELLEQKLIVERPLKENMDGRSRVYGIASQNAIEGYKGQRAVNQFDDLTATSDGIKSWHVFNSILATQSHSDDERFISIPAFRRGGVPAELRSVGVNRLPFRSGLYNDRLNEKVRVDAPRMVRT